jgi:hypothetical protein
VACVKVSLSQVSAASSSAASSSSVVSPITGTAVSSAATVVMTSVGTVPTLSTSSGPSVSVPQMTTSSHRQWASRSRHTSAAATVRRRTQADTSSEISAVAQAQAAYYKRKLEIAELQNEMFAAQHLQTMATLQVQQQYYSAKLCKLGEE